MHSKTDFNSICNSIFASPIVTVHYESVLQQIRQTGDGFCLRGERRGKNTSPLSSNAFGERRGASAAEGDGAAPSSTPAELLPLPLLVVFIAAGVGAAGAGEA